jgi:hypothetical protein
MSDQTVEVVKICPMWASNFDVLSSNGSGAYLVQFHKDSVPSCSCPAYKFSGDYGDQTCKHIKKVKELGCFYHPQFDDCGECFPAWNEFKFDDADVKWLSWTRDVINPPEPCPGCGMPLIAVRIAV